MLIGMLNKCWEEGITPDSKDWPIVQLEKWTNAEMVMGIAAGTPLTLAGSAILRVSFCDVDERVPAREVNVRCKIFPKGSTDWHGLIIGAEALDCKERGGLGHRVTEGAHVFEGIGIRSWRTETLNSGRVDKAYAVQIVEAAHPVMFAAPSAVDSDEEEEVKRVHVCAKLSAGCASPAASGIAISSIKSKLYYCGEEPLFLEPGEGVWLPVKASMEFVPRIGSIITAQKLVYFEDGPEDGLDVVPGILDDDFAADDIHSICVTNMTVTDKCIVPGQGVAAAVEAGVQTRVCDQCGFQDVDAWNDEPGIDRCEACERPLTGGTRPCSACGFLMRIIIMGGCFLCNELLREHDLGGRR
jgi:hypothetical protein